jgi:hypothetical protein
MAESFMIRFPLNGKPCYANVYANRTDSGKFYVHLVNPQLCPGIPHELTFTENDGKLHYSGIEPVAADILRDMVKAIESQLS